MLVPVVSVPPSPFVMLLDAAPFVFPGLAALHVPTPVNAAQDDLPIKKSAHLAKLGFPTGLP
jgi:hypothetical protein